MNQQLSIDDVDNKIIEERNREIKQVVKDLEMIHETFSDLQQLVKDQSEVIDNIEIYMDSASKNVQEGNKELKIAVVEKQESLMCYAKTIFGAFATGAITVGLMIVLI